MDSKHNERARQSKYLDVMRAIGRPATLEEIANAVHAESPYASGSPHWRPDLMTRQSLKSLRRAGYIREVNGLWKLNATAAERPGSVHDKIDEIARRQHKLKRRTTIALIGLAEEVEGLREEVERLSKMIEDRA